MESMNQKGFAPILIALGIMLILIVAGGAYYFGTIKNKPQSQTQNPVVTSKTVQSSPTSPLASAVNPVIIALKNGDLYSIQMSDLSSKKLTNGGGFATSNQYSYWFSPDHSKLVTKQSKTLLLITKEGSKPILQNELKGDVNDIVWRTDSNALLIWQTLKYQDAPSAGLPTLSEILTYDLETGKTTSIKQVDGWGGVAMWDKEANSIGYTTGGGEGGGFGTYHVLNLNTQADQAFQTRWTNPSTTPDMKEFIVFQDYDEKGNSQDTIKIYSLLKPDKPLRSFPSPKQYFRCSPQIASNREHPSVCLGSGKNFWFVDGGQLKSFDTQTGSTTELATLPTVNVDVPNSGKVPGGVTLLDATTDNKAILMEQQTTFSQSEYKIYDLSTGQAKPLGFTKSGTTQPVGTTGQEGQFWTNEALGFMY